ncbi:ThuA domain-containing protein [Thermotoga sp. KOL6]|uniref:ThuA domain-containing protein n=1 Tax=Thermotoga sp. KOL6 TaxID=126741 RepID=UPI000C78D59D|nr:ThuA domain-containing protein [Thermotoga sp. KOL6]PLV59062.1 hypothetical protein AS005_04705 [Thermotoga sp. KOL6]
MKIFAFLGDKYHDHDLYLETLQNVLEKGIIYDYSPNKFYEIRKLPNLVVIGRWNLIDENKPWLEEKEIKLLEGYIRSGGKLFAWHSGLAHFPESYNRLVGGRFIHHPPQKKVRYYGERVEFVLADEQYFIELRSDVEIFLWSESEDGKTVAGWKRRFFEGEILALTPAHNEGLKDGKFRIFLKRVLKDFLQASV